MPYYATQADCEAYIDGLVVDDVDRFAGIIDRAEAQVDQLVTGPIPSTSTTGRKVNTATLTTVQKAALSNAVCAQVEYRLAMGERFFVKDQHARSAGPDFTVEGKLARIGPKVREELRPSGLMTVMWGRAVA